MIYVLYALPFLSGKASFGPLLQQWGSNSKQQVPLLAHSLSGGEPFLIQGGDKDMSRGQSGGAARWFAHPSGGVEFRGHTQYPAFALDTWFLLQALQKWQLGFFSLFVSFVQNLPQLHRHKRIFSPLEFLCIFFVPGEVCPDTTFAALEQRVPGPRLFHSP